MAYGTDGFAPNKLQSELFAELSRARSGFDLEMFHYWLQSRNSHNGLLSQVVELAEAALSADEKRCFAMMYNFVLLAATLRFVDAIEFIHRYECLRRRSWPQQIADLSAEELVRNYRELATINCGL